MPRRSPFTSVTPRALHRDVGAGAHRDADVRLRERRRIVDRRRPPSRRCGPCACSCLHDARLVARAAPRRRPRRCRAARATASAVLRLSPVSMTIVHARRRAARAIASGVVALIGSATPTSAGGLAVDRDEHHGLRRRAAALSACALERRPASTPRSCEQARRCRAAPRRPSTCRARPSRSRTRSRRPRGELRRRAPRAPATIAAASGCSLARSRLAASAQQLVLRQRRARRSRVAARGFPSVSVPVLSTTSVSTFSSISSASASLISTPVERAAADADHDRHRRREPERARARDDQHRDRVDERVGEPRLRADQHPDDERRATATAIDRRERTRPDTRSASRWIGARVRCASPTMRDDLREQRVAPTRSARMTKRAGPVHRAAGDAVAGASSRPASARR